MMKKVKPEHNLNLLYGSRATDKEFARRAEMLRRLFRKWCLIEEHSSEAE